jgi:hypothetical protein
MRMWNSTLSSMCRVWYDVHVCLFTELGDQSFRCNSEYTFHRTQTLEVDKQAQVCHTAHQHCTRWAVFLQASDYIVTTYYSDTVIGNGTSNGTTTTDGTRRLILQVVNGQNSGTCDLLQNHGKCSWYDAICTR